MSCLLPETLAGVNLRDIAGCGRTFGRDPMEKRTVEVESTGTLPGRATTKLRSSEGKARGTGPYFDMSVVFCVSCQAFLQGSG